MRHSTQPLHAVRNTPAVPNTPAESFGRIARSTLVATPVLLDPARRSANESDIVSREQGDASVRRALAANGFGDAAFHVTAAGETPARRDTPASAPVGARSFAPAALQLEAAARAERSRRLGELAATAWRAVAERLRHLVLQARQRRQARATYIALRGLDARTLHDIGLHRSEILSVALELGGAFQATRVQSMRAPRGR